jgi:hypothetical protein
MRSIVLKLTGAVLTASLLVVAPANAVEVEFIAFSAANRRDARSYRAIWEESGERIVAAFEVVTCLPFAESIVPAVVAEDVSNAGGPEHPMRLRASYVRTVKQATLVHELGHRDLWQLTKRLDGVDGHMTLYLVLDRVWGTCGARSSRRSASETNPAGARVTTTARHGGGRARSDAKSACGCGTSC